MADDSVIDWQVMNSSKRKKATAVVNTQKKYRHEQPTTSKNRFSSLDDDEDDNEAVKENVAKPSPIFIPNAEDIGKMIQCVSSVIPETLIINP